MKKKPTDRQIIYYLVVALKNILEEAHIEHSPYSDPKNERTWERRMRAAREAIKKAGYK